MTGEPIHEEPSRRQWVGYWSMIVQQTQNAFNDKMAQFILIPLGGAVGFAVESAAGIMIALPFVLFAPLAGWMSDRFSKRDVMLGAAVAQVSILAWICFSVWFHNLSMALVGFFALAVQSAFFGPAKMGINKELVGSKHLGFATGIQQMAAMLAILCGQIVAGWWFDRRFSEMGGEKEMAWAAALGPLGILTLTAVPALMLAIIIPRVPAQGGPKFTRKLAVSHFVNLKELWRDKRLRQAALGVAFFWGIASFINLWSVKLAKELTGGGEGFGTMSSGFMAAASLGMAAGFGSAAYLLRKRIELGWVPLAGALMSLSALVILFLPFDGPLFLGALAVLAFAAAVFLAPLNAWMQDRYPANKRGEFQSAVNLMDCLAGILSVALIELFARGADMLGIDALICIRFQMLFVAIACLLATMGIIRVLPKDFLRLVSLAWLRTTYRIRAVNPDRLPTQGGVLMLPNHVSYIDAFLLSAASPRPLRFVMDGGFASRRSVNFFTKVFGTVLIRRDQPLEAIREIIRALREGDVVCYFPEGQLTRTGGLSPLMRGFELIARKAGHPVVPVWIDGAWGSIFSYERNRFFGKLPHRGKFKITVAFGKPVEPRKVDRLMLRDALMEASREAVAERHAVGNWEMRRCVSNAAIRKLFEATNHARRRAAWINGHQIRMINALQAGHPIHVWQKDPALHELFGLLAGFAGLARAKVVIKETLDPHQGEVWIGGDALRDEWLAAPPAVPVVFYDFSVCSMQPLAVESIRHFPCLSVDGLVVAMSMPNPPEVPEGFDAQPGSKVDSVGKVLPGWSIARGPSGRLHAYGPAKPDGLCLPDRCELDADGFLISG